MSSKTQKIILTSCNDDKLRLCLATLLIFYTDGRFVKMSGFAWMWIKYNKIIIEY